MTMIGTQVIISNFISEGQGSTKTQNTCFNSWKSLFKMCIIQPFRRPNWPAETMTGQKILLDVLEENNKLLQMISALIAAHPPLTSSERSGRCRKMLLNFLAAILLLILIAIIVFYLYKIDTKLDMLEEENKNISSRLDLVPSGEDGKGSGRHTLHVPMPEQDLPRQR